MGGVLEGMRGGGGVAAADVGRARRVVGQIHEVDESMSMEGCGHDGTPVLPVRWRYSS